MSKKIAFIVFCFFFIFEPFLAHSATSRWILRKKLAIIIDDMGYNEYVADKFLSLNLPLAFSFLPDAPFTPELARKFDNKGYTVMIHMPSQPLDYPKNNPGKNAIYVNTSKERTMFLLNRALKKIPEAIGLNNHMGSRILLDKKHLDYIMEFLRRNHLFFVDSATVKNSLGCTEAERFNVLCAKRQVFLDNKKNIPYIKHQLNEALKMLKFRNSVVAIGHCNIETYRAIKEFAQRLKPYLVDIEYVIK